MTSKIYDLHSHTTASDGELAPAALIDAAKAAGIIVYTIGFEAPSNGQPVLRDCASSEAHYFDV
ncbi:MAG: hypothetical protein COA99_03785, partial [Moraxellaceae bacterium]